jgi:hypothetical protein
MAFKGRGSGVSWRQNAIAVAQVYPGQRQRTGTSSNVKAVPIPAAVTSASPIGLGIPDLTALAGILG